VLKLYLNENLSWRIAKALREYGYDVISSHEAEMDQADDPTQFAFAVEQGRTVVTNIFVILWHWMKTMHIKKNPIMGSFLRQNALFPS
jgi:uncharacterized protein with PIN domain